MLQSNKKCGFLDFCSLFISEYKACNDGENYKECIIIEQPLSRHLLLQTTYPDIPPTWVVISRLLLSIDRLIYLFILF